MLLLLSGLMAYSGSNPVLVGWTCNTIYILIYITIFVRYRYLTIKSPLTKYVFLFTFIPFLSLINAVLFNTDSFWQNRSYILSMSLFLLFFVYANKRVSERVIIKILTIFGIIVFIIQIIQIIFPEHALFGLDFEYQYKTGDIAETRNGLYRFRFDFDFYIAFVCLFFYWGKFISTNSLRSLLIFIIFYTSIYLFLARQIFFCATIPVVFSLFYCGNKKKKLLSFVVIFFFIVLISAYHNQLFSDYVSKAEDGSDVDTRLYEYIFFIEKIVQNPMILFFGNGHLKEEITWYDLGVFSTDVGIVGSVFHYGLVWALLFYLFCYKAIVTWRKKLPLYIKMFFMAIILDSVLITPVTSAIHLFVFTIIIYLSYNYLNETSHTKILRRV